VGLGDTKWLFSSQLLQLKWCLQYTMLKTKKPTCCLPEYASWEQFDLKPGTFVTKPRFQARNRQTSPRLPGTRAVDPCGRWHFLYLTRIVLAALELGYLTRGHKAHRGLSPGRGFWLCCFGTRIHRMDRIGCRRERSVWFCRGVTVVNGLLSWRREPLRICGSTMSSSISYESNTS
jgi:hypothetical protein